MSQPIFPVEIAEMTLEQSWAENSTRSQIIYITIIVAIIAAVASLPFIDVNVSVQSSGIIRPVEERTQLKAPLNGKVSAIFVENNQFVEKGEAVLSIQSDVLDQQLNFNIGRSKELQTYISDLLYLISLDEASISKPHALKSSLYSQAFFKFRENLRDIETRLTQSKKDYDRAVLLSKENLIASKDLEERKLHKDVLAVELQASIEENKNQWQVALKEYRNELSRLLTETGKLEKEKEQYHLMAPESGTVQGLEGIYAGSYIFSNQVIAEISPDSMLIVESYVSPSDIGFLKPDMLVMFQVDAFNYNEWGTVKGKILSISNDIIMTEKNEPVFKVRSQLSRDYLALKNGYRGKLKKGMTVHARFTITQRSLYQLLFDKVDDWLNPTV